MSKDLNKVAMFQDRLCNSTKSFAFIFQNERCALYYVIRFTYNPVRNAHFWYVTAEDYEGNESIRLTTVYKDDITEPTNFIAELLAEKYEKIIFDKFAQ